MKCFADMALHVSALHGTAHLLWARHKTYESDGRRGVTCSPLSSGKPEGVMSMSCM